MASVAFEDVTKVYPDGTEAVSGMDLDVSEGELMVLVGPSGCGKTTALRMVAGFEAITRGSVKVADRTVNDVAPKQRDIAMVFQNYALYPHLTVAENIGFPLKQRKVPREEIRTRVQEAAGILGLTDHLDRRPRQLSGGQRQRVAMGRAIVREPAVFLMDEPLSNLDAKLRVQMRAEVTRVQRRLGVATLYVTHDQTEAMTLGDRIAVLRAGVLQQCDVPQVVYEHPANLFVASFIGSPAINLFEGSLSSDGTEVRLGSQTLAVPASVCREHPALSRYGDKKVVVGLRPEHLADAALASDGGNGAWLEGDVDLVESLGSELLVHFRLDAAPVRSASTERDSDLVAAATGTEVSTAGVARLDSRSGLRPGDRARFSVKAERLYFFEPEAGDAISSLTSAPSYEQGGESPT